MFKEQIEVSKEGFKISYYRLLTETTTGIIWSTLFVFYLILYSKFEKSPVTITINSINYSPELVIIIGVFILITSTAIGNLISGISFYLFSSLESMFAAFILYCKFPHLSSTLTSYNFEMIKQYFGVSAKNFVKSGYIIQRTLEAKGIMHSKEGITSRRTIVRNILITFLFFYFLFARLMRIDITAFTILTFLVPIILVSLSLMASDLISQMLINYNQAIELTSNKKGSISGNFEEIINTLNEVERSE